MGHPPKWATPSLRMRPALVTHHSGHLLLNQGHPTPSGPGPGLGPDQPPPSLLFSKFHLIIFLSGENLYTTVIIENTEFPKHCYSSLFSTDLSFTSRKISQLINIILEKLPLYNQI